MISNFDISQAVKLLLRPFDGSYSNRHSREHARATLRLTVKQFTAFADKKPESQPARYLYSQSDKFTALIESSKQAE